MVYEISYIWMVENHSYWILATDAKYEWPSRSLLDQLKELQALVSSTHPTKAQAGTCLMVLFLAFGLVLFPINNIPGEHKTSVSSYETAIGELNCSNLHVEVE